MSRLEEVGSAAAALVMMNADVIKESVVAYDGWQSLEVPRFGEGSHVLACLTVVEFHSVLKQLGGYLRMMMRQIEDCNEPIKAVSRTVYFDLIKDRDDQSVCLKIGDAVRSLRYCLEIQSGALDSRNNKGAGEIGMLMNERLDAAYDALWAAKGNLEGGYLAATVAYDQQAVRRMAA